MQAQSGNRRMTEDQKYEIATLASELDRKRGIYEAHAMSNTPREPIEREKAMIAYAIAETEYMEASTALDRAQRRIAGALP
jgi:hypothetical protein